MKLENRPTPETDAVERNFGEMPGKMRDMERQRDEARELTRELRDTLALIMSWWNKVDRGTDEIEESEVNTIAFQAIATLTKAKEILP